MGETNTVQVSAALDCRAAQEWEREIHSKYLQHWLAERRKSGKDKHSASLCSIGLSSVARMGKTNIVHALHWLVERRKSGKDKHSASICIGLPSGARVGKTNTVHALHWLVERRKSGKDKHSASICIGLPSGAIVEKTNTVQVCAFGLSSGARVGKTNTVQVSASLACRAAQEWERQTQCKSLHWLAERRKNGKDKHSASLCSIGLPSGARVGKRNTLQSAALACRAAQEWVRQTQCKSLQHWLVERRKNGKDKHSASLCIGLSSGAIMGKTNIVQVSALACRAAHEWERQTQCKYVHWLVERRKSGKDKHSSSLCIGLSSGARVGKTNTVHALHWLVERRKSGKDKHSASVCIGLPSGAIVEKTNTVQVSALACRAAHEWERQTQCKSVHLACRATQEWERQTECKSLHWLAERRENGKDKHRANIRHWLVERCKNGKTNTVQVSALACRAAHEWERQTQCKSVHLACRVAQEWERQTQCMLCIGLSSGARVGKTNTVQVCALACRVAQAWERQTQCKSVHLACRAAKEWERQTQCKLCNGLSSGARVGKTNTVQVSALACRRRTNGKAKHSASMCIWLVERRKNGKDKHRASIRHWLVERRKNGKTNTVQVSALACRAAQEWERQTQCKSISALACRAVQEWERQTQCKSVHLACRAAQEWERQTQFNSLHWLAERRKNGKDKHSASFCIIGLQSGARMGKTN